MHAQETIDTARFWAVYKFSYKTAPEQPEFESVDWIYLDMGHKVTKFYSRYGEIRDSIMNNGFKNGLSAWEVLELIKGYPRSSSTPVYYQFYDEKKTRTTIEYMDGYIGEEQMAIPDWTLHEDTATISGYLCKRATTHYRGRDWEVYYTSEIPLNRGPWKLWGLPGLITRATDADHYFLFEMEAFKRLTNPVPIVYIHREIGGKGGYTGAEYKKISKKTYLEYERLYHEDAIAFGDFETGSHPEFFDESGNPTSAPVMKREYIPIEK
jgi:hypothetical protein